MNDDRLGGRIRKIGGNKQERFGRFSGDVTGLVNEAAEAAEDTYGQAMDLATESAQTVQDVAVEGHDFLKRFMENNPHTTTAIALTLGIFIGYAAHRPSKR